MSINTNTIPSRALVTRSGAILRGYLNNQPWEGSLERDALMVLFSEPRFTRVTSQPYKVTYADHGRVRTHFPDVLAEGPAGDAVLEIKPDRAAFNDDVLHRTKIMQDIFAKEGKRYELLLESHIRTEPRFTNAKDLFYFAAGHVERATCLQAIDWVDHNPGATVSDLTKALNAPDNGTVITLIAQKKIEFNRTKRLGGFSQLFPINMQLGTL